MTRSMQDRAGELYALARDFGLEKKDVAVKLEVLEGLPARPRKPATRSGFSFFKRAK